eukprot:gene1204-1541_t
MLKAYYKNVAPFNNSADVFVFSPNNSAEAPFRATAGCKNLSFAGGLFFLALDEHHTPPEGYSLQSSLWSQGAVAPLAYRMMGHWRLMVPFNLADMLGYRYVWQLDDDSDIRKPLNFSVISWMKNNSLLMAGALTGPDIHDVRAG